MDACLISLTNHIKSSTAELPLFAMLTFILYYLNIYTEIKMNTAINSILGLFCGLNVVNAL